MADPREEMYETYKKPIYNYLYRCTYNSHIAEELTQETFLKAFKSLLWFRGDASIKTWLFRIARNTYLHYKERKGTKLEEQFDPTEKVYGTSRDDYAASHEKMMIDVVLQQLSEKERTLILLRDLHGFTYKEIGDMLREKDGQVKVGLHRARRKFQELYRKENGEDE